MQVTDILEQTGLPYAPVAFSNPPNETYLTYNEEITRRGADTLNCITEHNVSVELYAYDFYDNEAVQAVQAALDSRSIEFKQYDTTYINSEHLYCTRFEFYFISKDSLADRFASQF